MRTSSIVLPLGLLFAWGCQGQPDSSDKAGYQTDAVSGKHDWGFDPCKRYGWYGDGACDAFCPSHDPDCDASPLGPDPDLVRKVTRYPIIFQSGVGSGRGLWYFRNVAERLRSLDGQDTYQAAYVVDDMPAFQSVDQRAQHLAEVVDIVLSQTGKDKVNIIAHSMGGLDARATADLPGMTDKIASITTISTPHRGSQVADVLLDAASSSFGDALQSFGKLYGEYAAGHLSSDEDLRAGLRSCSEAVAPQFNENHPWGNDADHLNGIYYQSWAGLSNIAGIPNPLDAGACGSMLFNTTRVAGQPVYIRHTMSVLLAPAAPIVAHWTDARPNDGFVTVESAKWGTFRGCFPADHIDELGHPTPTIASPGTQDYNPTTGFDHLRFYRDLASDLAARGL